MNSRGKTLIKNIGYTLTSNAVTLIISVILTLFVPKILGVKEYSYWQLYIFYTSYVGFFHFGWIDGIYLKIGGIDYHDLDKEQLGTQFWLLNILEILIALVFASFTGLFVKDGMKEIILVFTAICGVITIAKTFLLFILQSTNRIQEYAKYTRYDRIIYFILVFIYLLTGGRSVIILMIFDIIARLIVLLLAMNSCKELIFAKHLKFYEVKTEIWDNISVGSKLMFANIASMLIVGIIRAGIENQWNVETFGKISLTLSISNLLLTFINAVGVVLFPMLRKTDSKKLSGLYQNIRSPLMVILYACLFLYFPAKYVLSAWLPNYADSLVYMAILFPMFIYESKMSLLINTYLKTLRQEKIILFINLISLLFSVLFTFIAAFYLKNLFLTILSIVVVLAIRCNLAEVILAKLLNLRLGWELALETGLTISFILTSYFLPITLSIIIYGMLFFSYVLLKRRGLKQAIENLRKLAN